VNKLLIGNKCDLENSRKVEARVGKEYAENNGMDFIETSAKTNQNVNEAFTVISTNILSRVQGKRKESKPSTSPSVDIKKRRDESDKGCAC
jgi:GTPase SAR1 family protein